jgi:Tfp pilus assembly protein PilO
VNGDIVGLVAVVLLFGGGTLFLLAISPIGKALAAKMLGRNTTVAHDEETAEEVKELQREVEELRHAADQMAELGERVDFLERLVAKQREAERLPPVR